MPWSARAHQHAELDRPHPVRQVPTASNQHVSMRACEHCKGKTRNVVLQLHVHTLCFPAMSTTLTCQSNSISGEGRRQGRQKVHFQGAILPHHTKDYIGLEDITATHSILRQTSSTARKKDQPAVVSKRNQVLVIHSERIQNRTLKLKPARGPLKQMLFSSFVATVWAWK